MRVDPDRCWSGRGAVLRLTAAREGLDDDHAAAAAWARMRQHAGSVGCDFGRLWFFWARRHSEQFASVRDVGGAVGAGEQAVMADAMEALWQYVHEEAANELVGRERHRLVAVGSFDPIILPLERDACLIGGDQPAIGDGNAVGIARQIAQNCSGPPNGCLA